MAPTLVRLVASEVLVFAFCSGMRARALMVALSFSACLRPLEAAALHAEGRD